MFLPFLGGVHLFDWDEINFAECAREMYVSGDYLRVQIGFRPFYEKPPFFFWLQALSMQLWGVNEYAARFPNAVAGLFTLALLMHIGQAMGARSLGLWWAGAWLAALLPHFYAKSGIIDPWFNLFIFAGQYFLLRAVSDLLHLPFAERHPWRALWIGSLCLGLAVLTKGPVAWLVSAVTFGLFGMWSGLLWHKQLWGRFAVWSVVAAAIPAVWFGIEMAKNGPEFFIEFIKYQYRLFSTPDAGHGGFPAYHFVVLLVGCFPISVFALRALWQKPLDAAQRNWWRWMVALLVVVLVLFTIVKSKIVHYSSLAYYPVTFLGAWSLWQGEPQCTWQRMLLWAIGLMWASAMVALPVLGQHPELLRELAAKDPFAQASLSAQVQWSVLEGVGIAAVLVCGLAWFAVRQKKNVTQAALGLMVASTLFIQLAIIGTIKRIEGYSQRAAIEFYEQLQGKDVSVTTAGFKSYAHLFYSRVRPDNSVHGIPLDSLMRTTLPRPLYVVSRVDRIEAIQAHFPQLQVIGRKNGFVFLRKRD